MVTAFTHDNRQLAETYDRVSNSQFESGKRLVERLDLTPNARVLDVGCGTGRLAKWIGRRLGPKACITGIDPLPERVAIARAHTNGVRFEVGQAEDLRAFADESFDAVVMSSVFHWVADKAKALAEVRRVLRPGGRFGVTTLPRELAAAASISRALQPLLERAPYAGHVDPSVVTFAKAGATVTELVTMVLASGLELSELHVIPRINHHASGEALVDFIEASSFGNFLRIVPEALRGPLRADLAATLERDRDAEGVIRRDWGVVFVATK